MGGSCFLKCMGYPGLYGPDGHSYKLKVRKHLALLVYLAVEERSAQRRDALVELFWSGASPEGGRHSLSTALSVLRGLLGSGVLRADATHVRLARGAVTLDLDRLEQGELLGDAVTPPLEVDGFLLDFDILDAPAFMRWRDHQHELLLPVIQSGLLTLADHARRSGDIARVMALADRVLSLDPLAEEGIRAKMEAFAMRGDRVSALRQFEEWKAELNRQLGAAPSELLERLADRLRRRGFERSNGPVGPAVQTEQWADRPFIGRTAEYRALCDAWDSSLQLDTRHILLTGESGIGKSTLALRFATAAALEGAAVARVQCFELEQRIPFGAIGALVTSLLDRPGAVATAPESLAEIARVVPRVRERFPNLPAPRKTEGESARLHFAEGVFALFDAIMDEQPLILIVDDYPRSDEASLAVLHMLLRRTGCERLLVVLSARPAEPGEPAPAARIRKGVEYLPVRHLELGPLSDEEGEEVLNAVLRTADRKPGTPERRAILRGSSGNPMALELLAQDWAAHGDAALAVSLPAMSADVPASALEAAWYDRLVERLLSEIPPRTRVALHLATILGPRLNDLDCFRIVDLTTTQTIAALTELVSYRVLRDVGGQLEFVNELVRGRLYVRIPSAIRYRLHNAAADRLLAAVAAGESLPGLEVAWHCIRARRHDEGTPFLMRGARDAITHGAPDEAARALTSAVRHLKGRVRDEALLLLAETYQEMAEWKGALECIQELSPAHREDGYLREMAGTLEVRSRYDLGRSGQVDLYEGVKSLITSVREGTDTSARVHAALSAASLAGRLRDPQLAAGVREAIGEIPLASIAIRDRAKVLLAKAMAHYHCREHQNGYLEVRAAAKALHDAGGSTDTTFVQIQMGHGAIAASWARFSEATGPFELAYFGAEKLGHLRLASIAAGNLAVCYRHLGISEEHLKWASTARKIADRCGDSAARVLALSECAYAFLATGHTASAAQALDSVKTARQEAHLLWNRQDAVLYEADINWLMGDRQSALERVDALVDQPGIEVPLELYGRIARWRTLFLIEGGRLHEACSHLDTAYAKLGQLDFIDRAEVLCSLTHLARHIRRIPRDVQSQARAALARLPITCSRQLRDLGLRLPD